MSKDKLVHNYIKNINELNNTKNYINKLLINKKISKRIYGKLLKDANSLQQSWENELLTEGIEKQTIRVLKKCVW